MNHPQPVETVTVQRQNLLAKIAALIDSITTLQVVTAIGPLRLDDGGQLPAQNQPLRFAPETRFMVTRLQLVQGDIVTVRDPAFDSEDQQELRQFHNDQVAQARQLIKDNMETLRQWYQMLKELD
ncbi:MAG: hypothetical protein R3310_08150 [Candidatus Competibacteraceae bacterium]|nr:hypothetical protein [Candidatus Competibacteraceae bacterium]